MQAENQHESAAPSSAPRPDTGSAPDFLSPRKNAEKRSWLPWIVACAVIAAAVLAFIVFGGRSGEQQQAGTGMAEAAPYAADLPISNTEMSQATSFSGATVTYIDGHIANKGSQTVTGITVQVGFRNDLGQYTQRSVMPLSLIRTRQPYVDTQAVSANPIKPGEDREFRLVFDSVAADWNQQYPEIRIIGVQVQ